MTQSANVSRSRPLKLGPHVNVPPESHPELNKLRLAARDEVNQLRALKSDPAKFNHRVVENLAEYLVQTIEALLVTNVVHEAGLVELNRDLDEMEEKMDSDGLSVEEGQIIVSAITQLVGIVKAITPQNPDDAETIRKALETAGEALEIATPYTEVDDSEDDEDGDDEDEERH